MKEGNGGMKGPQKGEESRIICSVFSAVLLSDDLLETLYFSVDLSMDDFLMDDLDFFCWLRLMRYHVSPAADTSRSDPKSTPIKMAHHLVVLHLSVTSKMAESVP